MILEGDVVQGKKRLLIEAIILYAGSLSHAIMV